MRRHFRTLVAIVITGVLLICFFVFWLSVQSTRNPALSVTYLGTIDGHGHWRLRFGITNVGDSTVFPSKLGKIEVFNHPNLLSVGATAPMSKLAPGQGHVVDAVLSEAQMKSIDGKWRYICLCGGNELRSRLYQWQWGPSGLGARVNWLIPQKLKGMRLMVKGTGDWIEPAK